MQLDFDFDPRRNQSIAYVGGDDETAPYRVIKRQDSHPENPFEAWECNWPMLASFSERHGRNVESWGNVKGAPDADDPLGRFTSGQLVQRQRKIAELLEISAAELAEHKRDHHRRGDDMGETLRDLFREALADNIRESDKLETLASLYGMLGIQTLCAASRGYSQGDYAEVLIIAAPEAMQAFGWTKAQTRDAAGIKRDLAGQKRLFDAWAWGDVYGAEIERRDGEGWADVESCWGFYGDCDDFSGLADFALSTIRADMAERKAARFDKLKQLIRANAPLAARQAILAAMGA